MANKQNFRRMLLMVVSILAGGFASAALTHRLIDGGGVFDYRSFILGAVFGGIGWFLAENLGEAASLLLLTGIVGAVALSYLQSEIWRIVVIAFLCGFNIGKICGGIYREYGG